MFTVAFHPATDECHIERQPLSSSSSPSPSPFSSLPASPISPVSPLNPPRHIINLPRTMESTSSAGRCLKILFVIYNTVLLALSATSVAFDLLVLAMLTIEKSTNWTLSEPVADKLPGWKNQMYQTHGIFILIAIQSYLAITGLSSPVTLSISSKIQMFYFIYPVIYYIETDDIRSSLVFILALLILYSISMAVTRAIKDECKKREDSMLFVYRGLLNPS